MSASEQLEQIDNRIEVMMLAVSNALQDFAETVAAEIPDSFTELFKAQVEQHIKDDPQGHAALTVLETWSSEHRPQTPRDTTALALSSLVIKEIYTREYRLQAEAMNLYDLAHAVERGTTWQQDIALREFSRVVGLSVRTPQLSQWLNQLEEAQANGELMQLLLATPQWIASLK